jgi:hypothetical protein
VQFSEAFAAYAFLAVSVFAGAMLWALNPYVISFGNWMKYLYAAVLIADVIFFRALFRGYVTWHGRKYLTGANGVVLGEIN